MLLDMTALLNRPLFARQTQAKARIWPSLSYSCHIRDEGGVTCGWTWRKSWSQPRLYISIYMYLLLVTIVTMVTEDN